MGARAGVLGCPSAKRQPRRFVFPSYGKFQTHNRSESFPGHLLCPGNCQALGVHPRASGKPGPPRVHILVEDTGPTHKPHPGVSRTVWPLPDTLGLGGDTAVGLSGQTGSPGKAGVRACSSPIGRCLADTWDRSLWLWSHIRGGGPPVSLPPKPQGPPSIWRDKSSASAPCPPPCPWPAL